MASDIVPFDTIGIEVIEDSDANFIAITVVGLGFRHRLFTARNMSL